MLLNGVEFGPRPYLAKRYEQLSKLAFQTIDVTPLSPTLGGEVRGVDLSEPVSDAVLEELKRAHLAYRVLVFRDQRIESEEQLRFAQRFGALEEHPFIPSESEQDEVVRFEKSKDVVGVENLWHSDVSWREIPSLGSILRAVDVPELGGDTLFADMVAAYACLDRETREQIDGLRAVHDFSMSFGQMLSGEALEEKRREFPAVEHPVVRTIPETGEKALYVNAIFTSHIVGLPREESDKLLRRLYHQAEIPEYQCRLHWERDSIAFWDNRVVQHYAANDYWPRRRVMHRVTIIGDRPV